MSMNREHRDDDQLPPVGAVYRATIEFDIIGGTDELVAHAIQKFGEGLIGTVLDKNAGDPIVIVNYASRDVDFSPISIDDDGNLTV